jgi:hypothetical protein
LHDGDLNVDDYGFKHTYDGDEGRKTIFVRATARRTQEARARQRMKRVISDIYDIHVPVIYGSLALSHREVVPEETSL